MDVLVKRKPKTTSKPITKGGSSANEDRLRTARWVVGFILLAFGVYTLWTLCAYLFTWQKGAMDGSSSGASGEWISSLLISNSFGLFGVLIPVMMIIFAFKIFMKRVKLYDHTLISFALVTIRLIGAESGLTTAIILFAETILPKPIFISFITHLLKILDLFSDLFDNGFKLENDLCNFHITYLR